MSVQDDPRVAFVYQEAVRGLQHQQYVVESLNTRGGNLIFAAAFATTLLGTKALTDGVGVWDWTAIALLFAVGALLTFILWPYYGFTFRFDPAKLLAQFVDNERPVSMMEMQRTLALRITADMANNWRIIQRIRIALQLALIALVLEILAWVLAIARMAGGS